jgi:hypothetical protein
MAIEIGVISIGKCDLEQIVKAIADFADLEVQTVFKTS